MRLSGFLIYQPLPLDNQMNDFMKHIFHIKEKGGVFSGQRQTVLSMKMPCNPHTCYGTKDSEPGVGVIGGQYKFAQ